jgi:hypothetical protein
LGELELPALGLFAGSAVLLPLQLLGRAAILSNLKRFSLAGQSLCLVVFLDRRSRRGRTFGRGEECARIRDLD